MLRSRVFVWMVAAMFGAMVFACPAQDVSRVFADGFERTVTSGCGAQTPPVPGDLKLRSLFADPQDVEVRTRGMWAVWWYPPFDHTADAEFILDRLQTVRCNAIDFLGMQDPPNPGRGFYYNVYIHHGVDDAFPDEWGNGQGRDTEGNPYLAMGVGAHIDPANLDHEGFHVFQFSADSPGFAYTGDSGWYVETSAQWYMSTQAPLDVTTFVQIGTIEANPQLALWHGWSNAAPGDPTDWNYTVRQYGMHSFLYYLTIHAGVMGPSLTSGFYGGISELPQRYLFQLMGATGMRHAFADWAAANTADFDYLTPAQVARARQELAIYGDAGNLHHYVATHDGLGTSGILQRPPAMLKPRGWAYNVIEIEGALTAGVNYEFRLLGDAAGSEGAAAFFLARTVIMTSAGNEYTDLDMLDPLQGSVTVAVPANAQKMFLVVASVPEHFSGNQTYGYQYSIELMP